VHGAVPWVARADCFKAQARCHGRLASAVALSLVSTFVLQSLVKVQRALEDPFVSPFTGEAIALADEEWPWRQE